MDNCARKQTKMMKIIDYFIKCKALGMGTNLKFMNIKSIIRRNTPAELFWRNSMQHKLETNTGVVWLENSEDQKILSRETSLIGFHDRFC